MDCRGRIQLSVAKCIFVLRYLEHALIKKQPNLTEDRKLMRVPILSSLFTRYRENVIDATVMKVLLFLFVCFFNWRKYNLLKKEAGS